MIKRGNKRGQVTLFIIIAIVVVALALTSWMLWPRIQEAFMSEAEAQAFLASEAVNLKDAVHDCVEEVSKDIIREQGMHAGYYSYGHLYAIDFAGPKLVVLYKDTDKFRINKLPSLEEIKSEFSKGLEAEGYAKINSCLSPTLNSLRRKGVEVEPREKDITAEIYNENILVKVKWPITLRYARASSTLEQKDIQLLIPLGRVWIFANDIVSYEVQQADFEDIEDEYNWKWPERREHLRLDTGRAPTHEQIAYMITTLPYRPDELEYRFYFAVDRA